VVNDFKEADFPIQKHSEAFISLLATLAALKYKMESTATKVSREV
jgi:hypothetical protein